MKLIAITTGNWFKPALGAALTAFCGLLLWGTKLGDPWINSSYDYLFRFGNRTVTNPVALILLDNKSYDQLKQNRTRLWDRAKHTELLRQLTEDGARLVVFDIFFRLEQDPVRDAALAEAIQRSGRVVLMAKVTDQKHPGLDAADVMLPLPVLLNAATNCGVGKADALTAETGETVRRHWPFFGPGEGKFHSLGWAAAGAFGAQLDSKSEKQWLRYYGEDGPWEPATYSYFRALEQPKGRFSNMIVFIGNWPENTDPGNPEDDKFRTPYTRWNGKAVGGVEIMATTFLNLVNGDWLRRPAAWLEALFLIVTGALIGGTLSRLKPLPSGLVAAGFSLTVTLAFVSWSYFSNYWFPWLVIAGGQVPCALAWTWLSRTRQGAAFQERFPGYTPVGEPFGEGAYGKVWLVRNATGQLQALKEIQRSKFDVEGPYERELRGIKSYKPVSNQHPGLLHIDHVNCNDPQGYFYYVMELGDALDPDWELKGEPYKPRDLATACSQAATNRMSARECIHISIALLEALDFLHQQGLVHRDIKPSNIIFVGGRPKFADVGLVRESSPDATWVGTEFYLPPEAPGTTAADIYALGKLLYVISTGKHPRSFSELSTTLVEKPEFMRLNEIICKACQPAVDQRYSSAAEMLTALTEAQEELGSDRTRQI